MVSFYRDSPEYVGRPMKYFWYEPLFEYIEDQASRIYQVGSDGWPTDQEPEEKPTTPVPKSEFKIDYYLDDKLAMSIHKVILTISGTGFRKRSYDQLKNPDNVRLTFDDACLMGLNDKIVYEQDGVTPNVDLTPNYHAVKLSFNEFPADLVNYELNVLDKEGNILLNRTGTVELTTPPWEES